MLNNTNLCDARDLHGKTIADQGNQIKKVNDLLYKIKSQSRNSTKSNLPRMACPDFVYRGGKCKHIARLGITWRYRKARLQGIVYEKVHLTYAQAWDAYNAAQKVEIKLFDELLRDLVQAIPEP